MSINFVRTPSKNYAQVQSQILGLIQAHLPAGSFSETEGVARDGRLNFTLFIHQPADVVMSHGVADKNYFFRKDEEGARIANRLRHVFVPGQWLKRRLVASKRLELAEHQVHAVGWPRLDGLLELQAQRPQEPRDGRRLRVLWAPTHDYARRGDEQVSLSSYPGFEPHLALLEQKFDVQVSLHPRNRRDKVPTVDKLLWADYVISDFGTMVYEAWALGKPVIFPDWVIRDPILAYLPAGSAERHIFSEGIGLHPSSPDELMDMISSGAGICAATEAFLHEYLAPEYTGCSARRTATLLAELAGEA